MEELVKYLKGFGFSDENIENIVNNYIISKMKIDTLLKRCEENNNWLLENGYSKKYIIKIINKHPSFYSYNIETIKQKIEDIISLGYTREQALKMTTIIPALFGVSIENIS